MCTFIRPCLCILIISHILLFETRAHEIYGVTIKNASCPVSADCHGDPKDIPKNCVRRPNKLRGVQMGYWWDLGDPSPGEFTWNFPCFVYV